MFVPLFINFRHSFRAKMIGNVAWHLRDKREMIAICSVALQSLAEVKGGCSAEVVQLFLYPLLFSRLWQKLRRRDNHTRWSIFRTIIHSSHSNYHHHPIHNASSRVSTSSEWQQWHLLDGEKTKIACFQCWQAEVDILSVWQHNRNHSVTLILYMFLNKLRFAKRNTNVVQGKESLSEVSRVSVSWCRKMTVESAESESWREESGVNLQDLPGRISFKSHDWILSWFWQSGDFCMRLVMFM